MQIRRFYIGMLGALLVLGFAFSSNLYAQITITALDGPVTVYEDAFGIPTISGGSEHDVAFVQGYLHARDRFFAMDLNRRVASGTSAELFGTATLADDIQLRTLGLRRAAWATYAAMSVSTRAWIQAYSGGVNAYLNSGNPLPPEYAALSLNQVPAWSPVDSIVVGKALAFQLSFDLDINNTILAMAYQQAGAVAGFDGLALFSQDLVRSAPPDNRVTVPGFLESIGGIMLPAVTVQAAHESPTASESGAESMVMGTIDPIAVDLAKNYRDKISTVPLLKESLNRRDNDTGSNTWAVSGEYTATGNAMLANDPHLSLSFPSIFTEEQLIVTTNGNSVSGVGVPGAPGIIQGCNQSLCWGSTVHPMDVTDTYQETLVLNGLGLPVATTFQGQQEPLLAVFQSYFVNDPADGNMNSVTRSNVGYTEGGITFIVPRRNNGPLVQVDGNSGLSVQYTGWGPTFELEAFRRINRANNLNQFAAALQLFDVGSQNFMVADVQGNIAYYTSAENPIRADLQNDLAPDGGIPPFLIRDGSGTLNHEWLPVQNPQPNQAVPFEIMPFSEMPQAVNPPSGYLANANNDPVGTTLDNNPLNQIRPGGGLYYLNPGYASLRMGRIDRVLQDLVAGGNVSMQDMIALQGNNQLLDAELMMPRIIAALEIARELNINQGPPTCIDSFPPPIVCDLARMNELIALFRAWDFSTPTGLTEGFDPGDAGTPPSATEIKNSVAATIFAVIRAEMIKRSVDFTLNNVGLEDFKPDNRSAYNAVLNLFVREPLGFGASGLDLFGGLATVGSDSDDPFGPGGQLILASVDKAQMQLFGNLGSAFDESLDIMDFRWGKLHRIVFDHPLNTDPFNVPNGGGLTDLAPNLPGLARAGGYEAVDASRHNARADDINEFMFGSGPARRFVGDMTPFGPAGLEVIPGGRSSVFFSPHYADQLPLWLTNDYHPLTLGTAAAQASSVNVVTFSP